MDVIKIQKETLKMRAKLFTRVLTGLLAVSMLSVPVFPEAKRKLQAKAPAVCQLVLAKTHSLIKASGSISHLMVSNNPESFTRTGTLFKEEFPDDSSVRMFYHHRNNGKSPYLFEIELTNHSGDLAKVHLLQGNAGPERRELSVGASAAERFFLAKKQKQEKVVEVNPEHSCPLVLKKVAPGETVSGILELSSMKGNHPVVQVRVFDSRYSETMAVKKGNHSSGVFDTSGITLDSQYTVGGDYALIPIGLGSSPLDHKTGQPHLGNYGILYTIHLTLSNPMPSPATVQVMFRPQGGPAKGIFLVNEDLIKTPVVQAYASYPLLKLKLNPGETRTVKIQTMPIGGSFYPVYIVAQPVEE